jgi:hypothetical protein
VNDWTPLHREPWFTIPVAVIVAALAGIVVAGSTTPATPTPTPTVTVTITSPPRTVEVTRVSRSQVAQRAPLATQRPASSTTAERSAVYRKYFTPAQTWAAQPKTRAVIACESGNRTNAVSATGKYRGLYQMDTNFWRSYGGLALAPSPDKASRAEQNYVAYRGFVSRGWAPWTCAR